jgi:hypothetical protein
MVRRPLIVVGLPMLVGGNKGVQSVPGNERLSNTTLSCRAGAGDGMEASTLGVGTRWSGGRAHPTTSVTTSSTPMEVGWVRRYFTMIGDVPHSRRIHTRKRAL